MKEKVKCPFCGYEMPIWISDFSYCSGITVKCKGRNCKREFQLFIEPKKIFKIK